MKELETLEHVAERIDKTSALGGVDQGAQRACKALLRGVKNTRESRNRK
jgi:hypothetical protein